MEVNPFSQSAIDAPGNNPWATLKRAGKAVQAQVNRYDMAALKAPDGLTFESTPSLQQLSSLERKAIAQASKSEVALVEPPIVDAPITATQNPFVQFGQQVNKYDQAAKVNKDKPDTAWQSNELSFWEKAWGSFKTNGLRTAGGLFGNRCYRLPVLGSISKIGSWLDELTKGAKDYHYWLGIEGNKIEIGPNENYKTYIQLLLTKEGLKDLGITIKKNFMNFLDSDCFKDFSLPSWLKDTFCKRNGSSITYELANGNICSAGLRSLGVVMAGWGTVSNIKRAHQYAKSKEDGTLGSQIKTIAYTTAHAIGQTIKTGLCWEAGTIGFTIGSSLCPVGMAATVAGLVGGSLLGACVYKGASKIIPDPPQLSV